MNRRVPLAISLVLFILASGVLTASASSSGQGAGVTPPKQPPTPPQAPSVPAPGSPHAPTGSGFSYQGRLQDGSNPANGQYDLQFTLYDASSGGNLVAGPVTLSNQTVTNGLFTVQLDFGPNAFQGDARWLGIAVRSSGGGTYTTLSPLQALTAAPYATSLVPGAVISGTLASSPIISATNEGTGGTGLYGNAPTGYGVYGTSQSIGGVGVYGYDPTNIGVYGVGGYAVYGSGVGTGSYGVFGTATYGVYGNGTGDYGIGVTGYTTGTLGAGVYGNGGGYGVYGSTSITNGVGVYGVGYLTGTVGVKGNGNSAGVLGTTGNASGFGVYGNNTAAGGVGVSGVETATNGYGVSGTGAHTGVYGFTANAGGAGVAGINNGTGGIGVYGFGFGSGGSGVYGESNGNGVYGTTTSAAGSGVYGTNTTAGGVGVTGVETYTGGSGVYGAGNGYGVYGYTINASGTGVTGNNGGTGGIGVSGISGGTGSSGVFGNGYYGVYGTGSSYGVYGQNNNIGGAGVYGYNPSNIGVYGQGGYAVYGSGVGNGSTAIYGNSVGTGSYAGYFSGNVRITGTCCSSADLQTQVDDPLDPANKYLNQAAVESPQMTNVVSGNATTDAQGDATVTLPSYFQATNRDFRYQLTVIGQFAQAIVSSKLQNNRFSIKTDKPNVEVSWQVTGVRNDPYAQAHPLTAEQNKPANEKGYYIHPELYGQPSSKSVDPEVRNPPKTPEQPTIPRTEPHGGK